MDARSAFWSARVVRARHRDNHWRRVAARRSVAVAFSSGLPISARHGLERRRRPGDRADDGPGDRCGELGAGQRAREHMVRLMARGRDGIPVEHRFSFDAASAGIVRGGSWHRHVAAPFENRSERRSSRVRLRCPGGEPVCYPPMVVRPYTNGGYDQSRRLLDTIPVRAAWSASSTRSRTPSFRNIRFKWVFTVSSLIDSRSAISPLRSPVAT